MLTVLALELFIWSVVIQTEKILNYFIINIGMFYDDSFIALLILLYKNICNSTGR